jgi:hypothetical protein
VQVPYKASSWSKLYGFRRTVFTLSKNITSQLQGDFGVCEVVATASLEFVLVLASFGAISGTYTHHPAISGVPGCLKQDNLFTRLSMPEKKHSRLKFIWLVYVEKPDRDIFRISSR